MARPTFIDLNPDENNQGLGYHPLTVNLARNTHDDTSVRICVLNKTGDVNLIGFNIIAKKSKTLTNCILCK